MLRKFNQPVRLEKLTLKHSRVDEPQEKQQEHQDHVGSREIDRFRVDLHGGNVTERTGLTQGVLELWSGEAQGLTWAKKDSLQFSTGKKRGQKGVLFKNLKKEFCLSPST